MGLVRRLFVNRPMTPFSESSSLSRFRFHKSKKLAVFQIYEAVVGYSIGKVRLRMLPGQWIFNLIPVWLKCHLGGTGVFLRKYWSFP